MNKYVRPANTKYFDEKIKKVINILADFEKQTEQKFLKYGYLLSESYKQIRVVLSSIQEMNTAVSSAEITDTITKLRDFISLLDKLFSDENNIGNASDTSLHEISGQLHNVQSGLENFKRFIKTLRMLGLSTKIESARIREIDNGFDNLAENVENLSNKIDDKVKTVLNKLTKLYSIIEHIVKSSGDVEKHTDEISHVVLSKAGHGISTVSQKIAEAKKDSDTIHRYSDKISQRLAEISTSLQYQDISKQQIDHINDALRSLIRYGENESGSGEFEKEIFHVCKLQTAQLKNTKNQFISATKSLIAEVSKIFEMTDKIFLMVAELSRNNGEDSFISLQNIRRDLKDTTALLSDSSRGGSELSEMINQVNATISELASFVAEVEDIGDEIELISLNSQIKAVRLGSDGASLGILAENIQKLSVNAKDQTNMLSLEFENINKSTYSLNNSLMHSRDKTEKLSDSSLQHNLNNLFNELGQIQKNVTETIGSSNMQIAALKKSELAIDELENFVHMSEQMFNTALDYLNGVTNSVTSQVSATGEQSRFLEELKYKYTMESERKTHEQHSQNVTKSNGNSNTKNDVNTENGYEFGDNVELF